MRGAVQCAWCKEIFSEENCEGAEILLNRTGVVTVLLKGRLHKFNTNKSKMEKEENEEARSKSEQARSDENEAGAEEDFSKQSEDE